MMYCSLMEISGKTRSQPCHAVPETRADRDRFGWIGPDGAGSGNTLLIIFDIYKYNL